MSEFLMQTYGRLPITFTSGAGSWLTDDQGEQYLDALSGIAVCNLGHAHPQVTAAIADQASRLLHTSNLYHIERQAQLAEKLCHVSGMERVFFGNSGAEANEAMIKIARLYGYNRGIKNPVIVVMDNAFHGRTMATLTATGNPKAQAGFAPLLDGFVRVPFDDMPALEKVIQADRQADNNIVAVMLEPVQGEGGIRIPAPDYLSQVRQLCDRHELLMLLDEIQTGIARSGQWFAYQNACPADCDINATACCAAKASACARPDVITSAKALGNGVPIGACMARGVAAETFSPGNHGSTFGGNPLASAAALAVLNVIEEQQLTARACELGTMLVDAFQQRFAQQQKVQSAVKEIRHAGLLIGIELDRECAAIVQLALEQQCLLNVTAGNVVRLLPPLTMTDTEAAQLVERVSVSIETFLS